MSNDGNYKLLAVAALALLVGLISGYVIRQRDVIPAYTRTEVDAKVTAGWLADAELMRRLEIAERQADEYRRDVSQINSRIAVIESKLTMLIEKKGG
jgi:hypothetical protein